MFDAHQIFRSLNAGQHFSKDKLRSSLFEIALISKFKENYWSKEIWYFSSLISINRENPRLRLHYNLNHITMTNAEWIYLLPVTTTQICTAHAANLIFTSIMLILPKAIIVSCFQLALLSHLHPTFQIWFTPESAFHYLNIIMKNFATHSNSAICTLYHQCTLSLI